MPFHIKKEKSIVDSSLAIYYKGDHRWSDNYDDRKIYDTEEEVLLPNFIVMAVA